MADIQRHIGLALGGAAGARLLTGRRDRLSTADARLAAAVEEAVPALAVACDLIGRFHAMLQSKSTAGVDAWLADAASSLLNSFASGIAVDRDAVTAVIIEPWSNDQTEGQITKLKLVKRQMYGCARLDLLRARLCTVRIPRRTAPNVRKSPFSMLIHRPHLWMILINKTKEFV